MTGGVRPRRLLHRGSVLASGLLLDTRSLGLEEARSRILRVAESGLQVFRIEHFLVARFGEPIRMDCRAAPGAPLVRHGSLHSVAPLEADEQGALEGGTESVVLVQGGQGRASPLSGEALEELSGWIDVSRFEVQSELVSLGQAASSPEPRLVPAPVDVRARLGVLPLAAEGEAFMASLSPSARGAHAAAGDEESSSWASRGARWELLVSSALRVLAALRAMLSSLQGERPLLPSPQEPISPSPRDRTEDIPSREASWLRRMQELLQGAAARLLEWSRLAPLVDRQHARYLARMLEMFDESDLDRALRHAIPLSKGASAAPRAPALRTPSPRTDLSIVPERAPATTSLGLGENLFEVLKQKYRRAFDRLVEKGELEKAAFVLAELLEASEEAVSFLERHGRLTLAAEIAEARALPPGLVVRQWFLAGNKERAVRLARKTGAFADAVARLERTHQDDGRALRLVWADSLAESGAYAAAVDAVWPVEGARALALQWMERAIVVGGLTGARMLVKKLRLRPESFEEVRDRVVLLLASEEQDDRALVGAVGRELLSGEPTAGTRVLAKAVARALLVLAGDDQDTERLAFGLLEASGDTLLRSDVASCRAEAAPPRAAQVRVEAFAVTDVGKQRTCNEDACVATFLVDPDSSPEARAIDGDAGSKGVLLGAFDAAGGAASGDCAANLALQTTLEVLKREFRGHGSAVLPWARCLAFAARSANLAIYREATINRARRGMGCAATVATLSGRSLLIAQVGDTRAYLLREGKLVQVTQDHSLLNDYIKAGHLLTAKEIEEFPHKNIITRAMGMRDDTSADLVSVELCRGDVILLCSDGLSSVVTEVAIRDTLLGRGPRAACEALLSAVLGETLAPDNIAIVVARVDGADLPLPAGAPVRPEILVPPSADGGPATSEPLSARKVPVVVHRVSADAGAYPVFDAAELPDGRVLVALGELGAWLYSREGKVQARFAEPAHHLVLSDHGDRVILVAPRGEAYRLARLELLTRRVRSWCDAGMDRFAPGFDGSTWLVSRRGALFAIDATSERWEELWTVSEPRSSVSAIQRDARGASAWFERVEDASGEVWTFECPSHTLRQRRPVQAPELVHARVSSAGLLAGWQRQGEESGLLARLHAGDAWKDLPHIAPRPGYPPDLTDDWVVVPLAGPEGMLAHLHDTSSLQERAMIRLDGLASRADVPRIGLRFREDRLLVFDAWGRILVISLKTGSVIRELRVS